MVDNSIFTSLPTFWHLRWFFYKNNLPSKDWMIAYLPFLFSFLLLPVLACLITKIISWEFVVAHLATPFWVPLLLLSVCLIVPSSLVWCLLHIFSFSVIEYLGIFLIRSSILLFKLHISFYCHIPISCTLRVPVQNFPPLFILFFLEFIDFHV